MAMQKAKSSLLAKLGDKARKAWEAHRADEVELDSFGELPAGIDGGIAELRECKLDTYKRGDLQGEVYFYAAGVVVSPEKHEGQKVAGLRTSIMEPLCETPKSRSRPTFEDHMKWVVQRLKKLGVNTDGMGLDDLEPTLEALKGAGIHFRFRTWKGEPSKEYPNPRVNHQWGEVVDYTPDEPVGPEIEDEPKEEAPPAKVKGKTAPVLGNGRVAKKKVSEPDPEEVEEASETEFDEFGDVDSLVEKAEGGDEESQDALTKMALESGASRKAVKDATSWQEVADLIVTKKEDDDDEEEDDSEDQDEEDTEDVEDSSEESEEYVPVKGDVVFYRPVDKKTKRPGPKQECDIIGVDARAKTVELRSLTNPRVKYKAGWDDLEGE